MLIGITGTGYRACAQVVSEFIAELGHSSSTIQEFGPEVDLGEYSSAILAEPLFDEKVIVVVKDLQLMPSKKKEELANIIPTIPVILTAIVKTGGENPFGLPLISVMDKVFRSEASQQKVILDTTKRICLEFGVTYSQNKVNELMSLCDNDLDMVVSELTRICMWLGNGGSLNDAPHDLLPTFEGDPSFEIAEAIVFADMSYLSKVPSEKVEELEVVKLLTLASRQTSLLYQASLLNLLGITRVDNRLVDSKFSLGVDTAGRDWLLKRMLAKAKGISLDRLAALDLSLEKARYLATETNLSSTAVLLVAAGLADTTYLGKE